MKKFRIISLVLAVVLMFSVVPLSASAKEKDTVYQAKSQYTPLKGDFVFFDYDGDNAADHVGIIYKAKGKKIYTIEGNSEGTSYTTTKVRKYSYKYTSDENIMGYVSTRFAFTQKNVGKKRANQIAALAKKQLGNKGKKYWSQTKAWNGQPTDWQSIFCAWVIEKVGSNPVKRFGWNAFVPSWVENVRKTT